MTPSFLNHLSSTPPLGGEESQPFAPAAFDREQDLIDTFSRILRPNSNFHLSYEFDCSHGIADLVVYKPSPESTRASDIRFLPEGWVYALRLLPYRKIFTLCDFISATNASLAQARKILRCMMDAGYIRKGRNESTWLKYRQPQPVTREIVAIEAKLRKWRKALNQATRYQHFAHYSWVVLDQECSRRAIDNINEFRRFNVGLASVSVTGELTTHHKPVKRKPKSPILFWMANVKIANELFG